MLSPAYGTSRRPGDAELAAGERDIDRREAMDDLRRAEGERKKQFIEIWMVHNAPREVDYSTVGAMGFSGRTKPKIDDGVRKRAEDAYFEDVKARADEAKGRIVAKMRVAADEAVKPRNNEPPEATAARKRDLVNRGLKARGLPIIPADDDPIGEMGIGAEAGRSWERFSKSVAKLPGTLAQVAGGLGIRPPGVSPDVLSTAGQGINRAIDTAIPDEGIQPSMAVQRGDAGMVSPRWLAARVPEAAGSLATSLVPGAMAGRVAGGVAAMAAGIGGGAAMETQGAFEDSLRGYVAQGLPEGEARKRAAIEASVYGVVGGVLMEKFPAAEFLVKNKAAMGTLTRLARGAFIEGSTEATQELTQALTQVVGGSAPEAMDGIGRRMAESGILGGIVGGGAGVVFGGGGKAPQEQTRPPLPPVAPQTTPAQPTPDDVTALRDAVAAAKAGDIQIDAEELAQAEADLAEMERDAEALVAEMLKLPDALPGPPENQPRPTWSPTSTIELAGPMSPAQSSVLAPPPTPAQAQPPAQDRGASEPVDAEQPGGAAAPVEQVERTRILPTERGAWNRDALVAELMEDSGMIVDAIDAKLNPYVISERESNRQTSGGGTPAVYGQEGARRTSPNVLAEMGRSTNPAVRAYAKVDESVVESLGGDAGRVVDMAEYLAEGKRGQVSRVLEEVNSGTYPSAQAAITAYTIQQHDNAGTKYNKARTQIITEPGNLPVGATFDIAGQTHEVVEDNGGVGFITSDFGRTIPLTSAKRLYVDAGTLDITGSRRGDLDDRISAQPKNDDIPFSPLSRRTNRAQPTGRTDPTINRVNTWLGKRSRDDGVRIQIADPKHVADKQARQVGQRLGVNVVFFEHTGGGRGVVEGFVDPANPNTLYLEAGGGVANVRRVLTHEWTHSLKETDPEAYAALVDAVRRADPQALNRAWSDYRNRARAAGTPINGDAAMDEALAVLLERNAGKSGYWGKVAGNSASMWQRIVDALRRVITRAGFNGQVAKELLRVVEAAGKRARNGRGRAGPLALAPAWHGSPHVFDKFSTDKIGTGEGAQAYGYGLYFAGAKEVAEYYRESLAGSSLELVYDDGTPIDLARLAYDPAVREAYATLKYWKGNFDTAISSVESREFKPGDIAESAAGKVLQRWMETGVQVKEKRYGRLYKVDLKPAEDEYLLWDRPLSEQSEKVKAATSSLIDELRETTGGHLTMERPTGQDLYHAIEYDHFHNRGNPNESRAASATLLNLGVRGIKYLDNNSRYSEKKSYNYVIFDDSDVLIEDVMMSPRKWSEKNRDQGSLDFGTGTKLTGSQNSLFGNIAPAPTREQPAGTYNAEQPRRPDETDEEYELRKKSLKAEKATGVLFSPKETLATINAAMVEKPGERTIGDPKRANPGQTEAQRRAIDAIRASRKRTEARKDSEVRAAADKRLKKLDAEREKMLKMAQRGDLPDDVDIVVFRDIAALDAGESYRLQTVEATRKATKSVDAYDKLGAEQARAFRQRRDLLKSPAERMADFLIRDIYKKSESGRAQEKKIDARIEANDEKIAALQKQLDDAKAQIEKANARAEASEAQVAKVAELERTIGEKIARLERDQREQRKRKALLDDQEARITRSIEQQLYSRGIPVGEVTQSMGGRGLLPATRGINPNVAMPDISNYRGQTDLRGFEESGSLTVKTGPETPTLTGTGVDAFDVGLQKNIPGFDQTVSGPDMAPFNVGRQGEMAGPEGLISWAEMAGPDSAMGTKLGASGTQRILSRGELAVIKTVTSAAKATKVDAAREYWYSMGLMSGPQTHAVNFTTNLIFGAKEVVVQRMLEALVNKALTPIMGKDVSKDAATLAEFKSMQRVFGNAMVMAWNNAKSSFDTEMPVYEDEIKFAQGLEGPTDDDKIYYKQVAIAGKKGRYVRIPSRAVLAVDEFFKSLWGTLEAAARAHRVATSEGLAGDAMWSRVDDIRADLSHPVHYEALHYAKRSTFQESLDQIGLIGKSSKAILSARRALPFSEFVIPFVKTVANLAYQGTVRNSPLVTGQTLLRALNDVAVKYNVKTGDYYYVGKREAIVRDAAQNLFSWGMALSLVLAAVGDDDGPYMTGTTEQGPNTPAFSIRLGKRWISYRMLEPFATMLALSIDGINRVRGQDGGEPAMDKVLGMVGVVGDRLGESTPMLTGLNDLMDLIGAFRAGQGTQNAATKWAANFASSWMPAFIRRPLAEADTFERDYKTLGLKGDSGAWGGFTRRTAYRALGRLSPLQAPPIKYDVWGDPIVKTGPMGHPLGDWAYRVLVPGKLTDPISKPKERLNRLIVNWNRANPDQQIALKPPDPFVTIGGKSQPMTDAEYERLVRESGQLSLKRLSSMRLDERSPGQREYDTINKVLTSSRAYVRERIVAERKRSGASK